MTRSYEMVERAEDMYSVYEEAMGSIKNAIEVLRLAHDCAATDHADALEEILSSMDDENKQYDAILAERDCQDYEAMTMEYWRDVL